MAQTECTLSRLLITDSGDCFGRFNDGSTVFLSSSCQILVETDSKNKQITHIINFINNTLKEKTKQIVNIRNKYYSSISLPPFMIKQNINTNKRTLSPITESIWTQDSQNNVQIENNSPFIQSFDGHTTLKLSQNQHEIHASFPVYIKKDVQVTHNGSMVTYYHHYQQTQIQSIYNHSQCWQFPLKLIENRIQKNEDISPNNKYLNIINKCPLPHLNTKIDTNTSKPITSTLQNTIAKISNDT